MHWIKLEDMRPVSDALRKSLQTKTKAAAWFASNCITKSQRELFVMDLQIELSVYNHTIDTYGLCGNLSCSKGSKRCSKMIATDYFFYLAFENSISTDYVTEKLLYALRHNAVPIVFGKANYTRFMPDGMYLNALNLGPRKLAQKMIFLMQNPKEYADYFRWKNHYTFHNRDESVDTDGVCAFCKLLNDEKKFKEKSVINNFREWWNSPDFCYKKIGIID
nr:alpha-(1,3)-fucosyltransferase C-like isoform X3 [Plodia interpunctella]XP_053607873.1 alpha-(1,3)-fucosyltransferase C-like isoform X3 [Plodia interpunctella]